MCGLCGLIGPSPVGPVQAMTRAMRHRGPDDHGVADLGGAALGMARLAILDLSSAGHQPMFAAEGQVCLVYNGETYNFRELRAFLGKRGHTLHSQCDTEVLLALYLELGPDFVRRLRGMFALAIYDKRDGPGRETLFLARDPFGIKPLLYWEGGGAFLFASELKALLASGRVPRDVDPSGLRLLLTYGSVTQPRTMLKGVAMLEPGHTLTLKGGQIRLERYYVPAPTRPELSGLGYPEQVEAVRDALAESVRLQAISDVPLGAFLSGGLDSALLCALLLQTGARLLNTYSVGFEAEGEPLDETREARVTADYLGTRHHHVVVRGSDVAERIGHIAGSLDQPSVDGVNSYFVSLAARQDVTVALSGTGGDEVFAGYPWFGHMAAWAGAGQNRSGWPQRWREKLGRLLELGVFDPLAGGGLGPWLEERRSEAGFLAQFAKRYYIFGPTGAARLLARDLRRKVGAGRAMVLDMARQDELAAADPLCRVSCLCLRGYTGNQLLRDIDSVSMAHSLEVRVPYLDPEVLGLALSLPAASKLSQPGATSYANGLKRILYDVAKPLLPHDFGARAKRGFGMPLDHWLLGPLREVFEDALGPCGLASGGLVEQKKIDRVKALFYSGRIGWMKPWLLMMTELWRREVLCLKEGKRP